MATKVKGSPPTKEKRGTSPSQQPAQQKGPTTQRGKSPITPKLQTTSSPSPTAAKRSTSTSPSGRNVPNYLKPTRTSGPESSPNPVKKNPSNETTLKPVMSRRKSLDKPLPPSHVPKTRVSAIAKDMKSQIPSSPSSARANASSSKATMGRIGKARSFNAEKESRVLHHVKKVENEATKGLSTKETINEVVDNDNIAHIDHSNVIDDIPQIEAIVEKVEEDFDRLNEDHKDIDDDIEREVIVVEDNQIVEPEIEVEEEVKINDESSITPKDENKNFDHPIVNETPNNNEEKQGEHESHATYTEELSVPDQDIENASEEKEVEEKEEEEGKTEVEVEANQKKEEVVEGRYEEEEMKESETVKEEEEDDGKKVEEKNKNENGGGGEKKVQVEVVQGKREMSVVSNDVIEETATKLREQRVNRVKALAGAFETVISNQ